MQNSLPASLKQKIADEAEAATKQRIKYITGENDQRIVGECMAYYQEGYGDGVEQVVQNPGEWGLAVIVDEMEAIEKVTAAMREADPLFEQTGGSTRHYVRDLLLPILEKSGFVFGKQESATPSDRVAQLEQGIEILKELCQLKHHKDTVGKDSFYEQRQPELWKQANEFLNKLVGH
jgi:hypothetical protein